MEVSKSQNQAKTPGQRLLEELPPLSDPLDETWLASLKEMKRACTVAEMRKAMTTEEKLSGELRVVRRLEVENMCLWETG